MPVNSLPFSPYFMRFFLAFLPKCIRFSHSGVFVCYWTIRSDNKHPGWIFRSALSWLLPIGLISIINIKLSAMDVLARATMKDAANCDTQCELQNSVNHQTAERKRRCWGFFLTARLFQCFLIPPKVGLRVFFVIPFRLQQLFVVVDRSRSVCIWCLLVVFLWACNTGRVRRVFV